MTNLYVPCLWMRPKRAYCNLKLNGLEKKSLIMKKKDCVRKNLPLDPEALDCDCDLRKDVGPPVVKMSRDDG